jgi:LacI family transcriptional regulator
LTTVAQFQSDVGVKAAQILMERMSGNTPDIGSAIEMPFKLIERQST